MHTKLETTSTSKPQRRRRNREAPLRGLHLVACGLNHVRAALAVREQYALNPEQARDFLEKLRQAGAAQALVVSTCNRTEVYAFSNEPQFGATLRRLFMALAEEDPSQGPPPLYEYDGAEAVRHLFAVGAGLDSLILGENQIKQQLQQAWELTQQAGLHGPELTRLIDASHRCGKRIRTETDLNVGTLCVGKAAVLKAEHVLGSLTGRVCVVIGAGKVGRIAARALAERQPARLIILNRTLENAQELVRALEHEMAGLEEGLVPIEAAPIGDLPALLGQADFVLGAAYAPELILTRADYCQAVAAGDHPTRVCLVDAAVPRIFVPELEALPWVRLLDIEHMSEIIEANQQRRSAAAQQAWSLVEEETEKYRAALLSAELAPVIQRLTTKFDAIMAEEMRFTQPDGDTLADEREQALRRRLKQRLLHEAITELKQLAEER